MKFWIIRMRRKQLVAVIILIGLIYLNNTLLQRYKGVRLEKILTCSKSANVGIKLRNLDTSGDDLIGTDEAYEEPIYTKPVDLVYLWVNGSDPKFVLAMKRQKALEDVTLYESPLECKESDGSDIKLPAIVVYPAITEENEILRNDKVHSIFIVTEKDFSYSVILPKYRQSASGVVNRLIELNKQTYITACAFITNVFTSETGKLLDDWYIINGRNLQSLNTSLVALKSVGATIHAEGSNKTNTYALVHDNTRIMTKNHEYLKELGISTLSAILVFDPFKISITGTPGRFRFEDNDQLLFSLRSVELYAPWIRHIYIITNDQVPNWLNTSNPRISVKSTADIFPNKEDLPSFSSPAIESHIHRMPELSETYLFMCDDFFFGKPVELSDFYTHEKGLKIIWDPVTPNCGWGCKQSYLGDGKCEEACNRRSCGWDFGDCGPISPSKIGLDTSGHYARSVYNTISLFNRKFNNFKIHAFPPHLPLLVNKKVAADLDNSFYEEFKASSALHFRSYFNIQYTMAYYEFVESSRVTMTAGELFDELDEDKSGSLSSEELDEFKDRTGVQEVFCKSGSTMTKQEFMQCQCIIDVVRQAKLTRPKYKHEVVTTWDRHFIIMRNSWIYNQVQLQWVRLFPSKFNAVNDNLQHEKKKSDTLIKDMKELYLEKFPKPSQFELKRTYL